MAITNSKTWEYVVNLVESVGSGQQDRNERLTLALKRALTDTGGVQAVDGDGNNISLSSPMEVVASSNGVTADASDNWDTQADIVYDAAGSAHSWIHLRLTDFFGSGDHLHMLYDCRDNSSTGELAYVSWVRGATGFSGGTITNAPTNAEGTDELITRDGSNSAGDATISDMMWGSDSSVAQCVLHVRIADDGSAGGWFVCSQGAVVASHGWQIEEDGIPGETHPFWVWGLGYDSNSDVLNWGVVFDSQAPFRSLDTAGLALVANLSMAHTVSPGFTAIIDNNTSTNRFVHPGYLVDATNQEVRSALTDMWWGSSVDSTGDGSPASGNVVRRQVGDMVIPWPSGVAMQVN